MSTWPGKLLVLGEYTVLLDGEALAIPLKGLNASWTKKKNFVDDRLISWSKWLLEQQLAKRLPWSMDIAGFQNFIQNGGSFLSPIPVGCGLGSSGALVAGFVATWSKALPDSLSQRKAGLAFLESYFHGSSSGLDPLVSLQNEAIHLIKGGEVLERPQTKIPPTFFLVDTQLPRSTAPLVQLFNRKLDSLDFRTLLQDDYMNAVQRAISALITNDESVLWTNFREISEFQRHHFKEMIPEVIYDYWSGADYNLKLCGAGGGGFFLGLSETTVPPVLPFRTIPLSPWLVLKEQR